MILSQIVANSEEQPIVREQAVVSLGRLAAPSSLRLLIAIATNPHVLRRERAYALHALAHFPSSETLDALIEALLKPDDETLSEDAAWAVSVIAESHPQLVERYLDDLRQAFETSGDGYTKGCIIFGFGRGKFEQCLEFVDRVLLEEENAFVLDDACYFIESTGYRSNNTIDALGHLIDRFSHDAIVTNRAIKALEVLKKQ
jgi:HEAT repeat protein